MVEERLLHHPDLNPDLLVGTFLCVVLAWASSAYPGFLSQSNNMQVMLTSISESY